MLRYVAAFAFSVLWLTLCAQQPWPDSLNTAKTATYLSPEERNVILEMNKVRTNPKRYAQEVVAAMKKRFVDSESPLIYLKDDGRRIMTNEGVKAIDECVQELMRAKPVGMIYPSKGVWRASRDHAKDQASTGATGHSSKNGASPWDRMDKYGVRVGYAGENVDYGNADGLGIVLSLLIDDGVSSRGHRHNIMSGNFRMAGVAIGPHPTYGFMCVIDYVTKFVDK